MMIAINSWFQRNVKLKFKNKSLDHEDFVDYFQPEAALGVRASCFQNGL